MESSATVTYNPHNSKKLVLSGSSLLFAETEVMEMEPSSADRMAKMKAKGKLKEVADHAVIELDMDDDCSVLKKRKRSVGISLGPSSEVKLDSKEVASNKKGEEMLVEPAHSSKGFNPGSNNFFDLDDYVLDADYSALESYFDSIDIPAGVEVSLPLLPEIVQKKTDNAASSMGLIHSESSSSSKKLFDGDVGKKFESFKKFDTVVDYSDHHFANKGYVASKQPPKNWAKKIQNEWKILEKDLPDTIFVRAYESRMDLLRAVIIGAEGTPYHDGLFFFDVCFPSNYPKSPPLVHYRSGGLHINPNLYDCGTVCLSLLNTWTGGKQEMWLPDRSTMLQVLVSIQGLILNMNPYFNEPGYEDSIGSAEGEKESLEYNEEVLILSLKTMVYTMNKPPKNFEDLVIGHFQHRVRDILTACKAYTEGVQVGCLVKGGVQDVDECNKRCSPEFRNDVGSYIKTLIAAFKNIGAKEAEEFLSLSVNISSSPPANPTRGYKKYW